MKESLLPQFQKLYEIFRKTEDHEIRLDQSSITEVFREIIEESLKNQPLLNEHLTGLIQMFKAGCSDETFERYLTQNIANPVRRQEILNQVMEIGQGGYTGAGLNSIQGLHESQLYAVKSFLQAAFIIQTIEEAQELCREFESKGVPKITAGIYSPWLYYINPELFPILNGSHHKFRKWLGLPDDYATYIQVFNHLKTLVNEKDLGLLDTFAYHFEDFKQLSEMKTLNLQGKKLFKISHGIFVKSTAYRQAKVIDILNERRWIMLGKDTQRGQADAFMRAEIGDFVYVCYGGDHVTCLAKIKSVWREIDAETRAKIPGEDPWIYREIEPLFYPSTTSINELKEDQRGFMPSGYTTFKEVPKNSLNDLNQAIFLPKFGVLVVNSENDLNNYTDLFGVSSNPESSMDDLNKILYGPPGTGKTYHTIDHALSIIDGKKSADEIAQEREVDHENVLKKTFDELVKQGRIAFCTFHQSMGYEDFIEGIKPLPPSPDEANEMQYAVVDGIFKRLCTEATFSLATQDQVTPIEKVIDFSQLYDQFVSDIRELSSRGETKELETVSGGKILVDGVSDRNNLIVKHRNSDKTYIVSKERLIKLANKIPDLNTVSNIDSSFREAIGGSNSTSYWAALNAIRKLKPVNSTNDRDFSKLSYEDKKSAIEDFYLAEYDAENAKKYVLIIDEINRGNVAQIFGELITLIEDDKRMGKKNALRAKLTYSNHADFSVPPNLYIIGTMNTADRSVEALDTALRRRFSFVPMIPKPEKLSIDVEGVNLKEMLYVINRRLEVLIDADHTIGHAWLWNIKDLNGLKKVFKDKIIPLLQEFFYNDYEKIGLVLGEGFVTVKQVKPDVFAKFNGGTGLRTEYSDRSQFTLNNPDELSADHFISIYAPIPSNP